MDRFILKEMKKRLFRLFNFLLVTLLSCFGVASSDQVMAMYGVPSGSFEINGRVKNLKSKPVRDIEVEVQDGQNRILGTVVTRKDGAFEMEYRGWPHREVYLIARDVDGKRRGEYLSDTTLIKLDYPESGWNQGKAKVTKEVVLKYKSEKKNRRYNK